LSAAESPSESGRIQLNDYPESALRLFAWPLDIFEAKISNASFAKALGPTRRYDGKAGAGRSRSGRQSAGNVSALDVPVKYR
jgi:hypothetical protein